MLFEVFFSIAQVGLNFDGQHLTFLPHLFCLGCDEFITTWLLEVWLDGGMNTSAMRYFSRHALRLTPLEGFLVETCSRSGRFRFQKCFICIPFPFGCWTIFVRFPVEIL